MTRLSVIAALFCALVQGPAFGLEIFACEPEWAALASEIGGDDVSVYSATTALQDVHRIQARPSLIARYRQAELLICTGAGLEAGWLPALEQKGNNPRIRPGMSGYLEAARLVPMLGVPESVDRAQGDVHPYGNPHIQTDPRNIAMVAATLVQRMAALDPDHAQAHRQRYAAFTDRWEAAMLRWEAAAAPLRGLAVVSAHQGWPYLYDWLGLREVASLEPKPGVPPSAGHLQQVLAGLETRPARFIVYAAYQDARPAQWLAERAGIPAIKLPFSVGGVPGADNLVALFELSLQRLLDAAGREP